MSDTIEIKIEHQAGGWVWVAVMPSPGAGLPVIVRHSREAFPTKEAALRDADDAFQGVNAPPNADVGT
jgi:hypothetical protein